ncbi:hypothetical protein [Fischerella sp. JS2]|nr:hypothetical protein [Fischerella sp. JS2]
MMFYYRRLRQQRSQSEQWTQLKPIKTETTANAKAQQLFISANTAFCI